MAFDWIEPVHHASNWRNCSKCMDLWIERENAKAKIQLTPCPQDGITVVHTHE